MHFKAKFRYCPACGNGGFADNNFKSKRCPACGFVFYHNPSAAVAAFIFNEKGELLVCRRGKEPTMGTLDLPGGFVDYEETAEDAMRRELMEETGLQALAVTYLFSLPNSYAYSGLDVPTLDLFFRCTVPEGAAVHPADDVSESMFVPLPQVQPADFGLPSIRRAVAHMKAWAEGK